MSINAIRLAEDGTITQHDLADTGAKGWKQIPALLDAETMEGFGILNAALNEAGIWAYCDEEGRLTGRPVNPAASIVLGHIAPYPPLVGPIVFVAEDTEDGTSNPPLTQDQIDIIENEVRSGVLFAQVFDLL